VAVSTTANSKKDKPRRSVWDLISRAEIHAEERERRAAEQKAKALAKEKRQKEIAREKYLESISGREYSIWQKVEELIDSKQPGKYDEAVRLLADLSDLSKKSGEETIFSKKLKTICEKHHRKPTFLNRLKKKGLTN
jgi:uncharacterized Zn finger protein